MKREYYAGRDLRRAANIEDLRRMARRRLPNFSFEYVEGGAEDEATLRRNRDVFEKIAWLPRALVGILPAARQAAAKKITKISKFSGKNQPGRTLYVMGLKGEIQGIEETK